MGKAPMLVWVKKLNFRSFVGLFRHRQLQERVLAEVTEAKGRALSTSGFPASSPELSSSCRMLLHPGRSIPFSCTGLACAADRTSAQPGLFSAHRLSVSHSFTSNPLACAQHCLVNGNDAFFRGTIKGMDGICNVKGAMAAKSTQSQDVGEEEKHEAAATAVGQPLKRDRLQFDVVIVGAGIIGLSIAHQILSTTSFSVAVVDAARSCSGATGAGQGYVWLGHRSPESTTWDLAKRSAFLWEGFAQRLHTMGLDPLTTIGFKKTGGLVFGTSSEHAIALRERAQALCENGVKAEFLNANALKNVEPELEVGAKGSAVLSVDDCQIDAHLAASYILGENRKYSSSGRFQEFFYDPAVNFLWADQVAGVQTTRRDIFCNKKVVMAAGAWSGELMKNVFEKLSTPHVLATKPRKGHLLVLEGLPQISLKHGLMEFAYEELADSSSPFGVASTATLDAEGRLLLGSSRQFAGFDYNLQYDVMESILEKAAGYLPALGGIHLVEALNAGNVRVGHRPYVPDGRPMIGKVPGLDGLLLATGHEGEGLSLSLGTAEMIVDLLLEKEHHAVDPLPFSPAGRLAPPLSM